MMMTRKNWALTAILALLTITYALLLSNSNTDRDQDSQGLPVFAVSDTASIQQIALATAGQAAFTLSRNGGSWVANNTVKVDGRYIRLLQSVLLNVEAVRPVATNQIAEVSRILAEGGTKITVSGAETRSFVAGGDAQQQVSYFSNQSGAYVVQLPGYSNYVSSIFNQSIDQIRDKTILSLNSNNFLGLKLTYPDRPKSDFEIVFEKNKLGVKDMDEPDSVTLFGYMSLFEPIEALAFVPASQSAGLRSQAPPIVKINARTIHNLSGTNLWVYPQQTEDGGQLAYLPDNDELIVLDARLVRALLISRQNLKEGIK